MVSGDVIRIAVSIGLAVAATLGAVALFRKEAATLPEVMRKDTPRKLHTEKLPKSPPEESSLNPIKERLAGSFESSVTETSPNRWETASEIKLPDPVVALGSPDLTSKIAIPGPELDHIVLQEKKDIYHNINYSKTEITDNLSSHRVKMTKESVNTIFNKGIRDSFSKVSDPKLNFEALSGNLKIKRQNAPGQPKATVNLYKIGSALGGETYLCITAAKLACVKAGQTDKACEHPQKAVLQNCVDKAMESADVLISSQLKQEAG
jgi:hypothetical protein